MFHEKIRRRRMESCDEIRTAIVDVYQRRIEAVDLSMNHPTPPATMG